MRHGSVPSESGPKFAPHFNSCGIVGLTAETPVRTIATYTATFIPTNVVVMGCRLPIISVQYLPASFRSRSNVINHTNRSMRKRSSAWPRYSFASGTLYPYPYPYPFHTGEADNCATILQNRLLGSHVSV